MNAIFRFLNSFKYAFNGFYISFRAERNMRVHTLAAFAAVALGLYTDINTERWCAIVLCIAAVFSAELFNTAIERMCDFISPGKDHRIKVIKDLAAAAVLSVSIGALIIALLVFAPAIA